MKSSLIFIAILSTSKHLFLTLNVRYNFTLYVFTGYALQCQVCGTDGTGICDNAKDNGISQECAPEVKACWYQLKHRAVSSKFGDVEYEEVIVRKCADGYEQNACEDWNFGQVQANRFKQIISFTQKHFLIFRFLPKYAHAQKISVT